LKIVFQRYLYLNYHLASVMQYWLRPRITRAGILALAGFLFTLTRADTNLSVGYQALSFLFWLILASLIACLFVRTRVRIQRFMPRIASVGTPLKYRLVVYNNSRQSYRDLAVLERLVDPRPTLLEFISAREPGEERRNWFDRKYAYYRWQWLISQRQKAEIRETPIPPVPGGGHAETLVELIPQRRGVLQFKGVAVACPDPFGLFRRLAEHSLPQSLLILPKRYPIPAIPLPGTMRYQPGGVTLAASVGESEEFVSLRDYRPGDPLRHIHWRSWAKSGKPIVKEFQDEFFVRHALILDTFCKEAYSEVFEEAVSVAASFACAIQTQDSLLDLLFAGPKAYCFTVGRGVAHIEQLLEILTVVTPCTEKPFEALQQLVLEHSRAISGCVCVFLQWDEARQKLVRQLHAMRIPLLVLVIVPDGHAATLDPGPLKDCPELFHVLEKSRVEQGLAAL
jgi:uncharacterized protein (DUF58 family)